MGGELVRGGQRVAATADAAGELGVEVDEHGAGNVRVVVLAPASIRVGEVPTHVADDDAGLVEARGQLVHGHQG